MVNKNRGFLYGDGFFETMRIENNKISLLDLHIERAKKTALLMELNYPSSWDESFWMSEINKLKLVRDSAIRITFYRGGEGLYSPNNNVLRYEVNTRSLTKNNNLFIKEKINERDLLKQLQLLKPIKIGPYQESLKSKDSWSCIKSISSLFYVKAGLFLKKSPVEDLLIFNIKKEVIEGLSSNIIIRNNNKWLSPLANSGQIHGVYLDFLNTFLKIESKALILDDIVNADLVFFINAVSGFRLVELV